MAYGPTSGSWRWTGDGHPVVGEYLREPLHRLGRRRSGHGRQFGVEIAGDAIGDEELLETGRREKQEKLRGGAADPVRVLATQRQVQDVARRHDRAVFIRPTVEFAVEDNEGFVLSGVPMQWRTGSPPPDVLDQREAARGLLAGEAHAQTQTQVVYVSPAAARTC